MTRRKRSVAIMHYSAPPVIGGVEFIVEAHVRHFAKHGLSTRLVVGEGGVDAPGVRNILIPEMASSGKELREVLEPLAAGHVPERFEGAVKRMEHKLTAALRGVDVCMIHNVMTMHFNLVLTTALANIIRRTKRIWFIAWTHDMTFVDPAYEPLHHRRYPWSLLMTPLQGLHYCAISRTRQREARKLFGPHAGSIPVIPDGINVADMLDLTPDVRALFRKEGIVDVDVVALTPARILRRKNLGLGMEIIHSLKEGGRSVRWIVTGAPDPHNPHALTYYRMLQKLRKQRGIEQEVIFLCERFSGPVSNADVHSLYRMSDILLFPSDREGFGLPVLEAALAGLLPVIARIPPLEELASRDSVFIEPGEHADAVARKIVTALKTRNEVKYRKKVFGRYSWESVFPKHILPAVTAPSSVWKR